jgi:hypothetical protein
MRLRVLKAVFVLYRLVDKRYEPWYTGAKLSC